MKVQSSKFKVQGYVILFLICLVLCGCITEYIPTGIKTVEGILVVDGIITGDETCITLSRSLNIIKMYYPDEVDIYVNNAGVYVECDDGTRMKGYSNGFQYIIKTGTLNPERQYRLKIEIDESEYCSEYLYPAPTPEIDSLFWMKRSQGQPVMIYVTTQTPDSSIMYYRWSFKEEWEINSRYYSVLFPYYCWNFHHHEELLVGSAERTTFGSLTAKIAEIHPSDRKLSVLYRIDVKQNAISKRGYEYFSNIINIDRQIGSIFAPIPSELRGNLICTTDPGKLVIGHVDVSSTAQKRIYIPNSVSEYVPTGCKAYFLYELSPTGFSESIYTFWAEVEGGKFVPFNCVDCTYYGTEQKPEDWPGR